MHWLILLTFEYLPGAKINQQRWSDGWTVLHLAAIFGNIEVVKILLEAGANTKMVNSCNLTPADVARNFGYESIAKLCDNAPPAKFKRERQIHRVIDNNNTSHEVLENESKTDLSLVHIEEVIKRRQFEKMEAKRKLLEEENLFNEEVETEKSVYSETIWALKVELNLAEENEDDKKVSWCQNRIREEETKMSEVHFKKQQEWKDRKRKEAEFKELLRLKHRNRTREVIKDIPHIIETKHSSSESDNIVSTETLIEENVNYKVTEKHTFLKDSNEIQIDDKNESKLSLFTKVVIVGSISGLILGYFLSE